MRAVLRKGRPRAHPSVPTSRPGRLPRAAAVQSRDEANHPRCRASGHPAARRGALPRPRSPRPPRLPGAVRAARPARPARAGLRRPRVRRDRVDGRPVRSPQRRRHRPHARRVRCARSPRRRTSSAFPRVHPRGARRPQVGRCAHVRERASGGRSALRRGIRARRDPPRRRSRPRRSRGHPPALSRPGQRAGRDSPRARGGLRAARARPHEGVRGEPQRQRHGGHPASPCDGRPSGRPPRGEAALAHGQGHAGLAPARGRLPRGRGHRGAAVAARGGRAHGAPEP